MSKVKDIGLIAIVDVLERASNDCMEYVCQLIEHNKVDEYWQICLTVVVWGNAMVFGFPVSTPVLPIMASQSW